MKTIFRNNFGMQCTTPSFSIYVNRETPSSNLLGGKTITIAFIFMFFFWDIELWFGDIKDVS